MNAWKKWLVLMFCAGVPMLMAPTGGIPNISAAKITSGTLSDARLTSNVSLKNAANTFTANQHVTASGAAGGQLIDMYDSALTGTGAVSIWMGTALGSGTSGGVVWNYNSGSPFLSLETFGASAPVTVIGSVINLNATTVQTNGVSIAASTGSGILAVVGCTTNPAPSFAYSRIGNLVTARISQFSCTSNNIAFSLTGVPAGARPASTSGLISAPSMQDNGIHVMAEASIDSGGTITFTRAGTVNSWSNVGTKGIFISQITLSYAIS